MRIRICPSVDAYHHASYLFGLFSRFGRSAVRYSCRGFPHFPPRPWVDQGDDLAFIVEQMGLKVFVDLHDKPEICETGLAWCDVYGKMNFAPDKVTSDQATKIVILGPTFPVRLCGLAGAVWNSLRTYLLAHSRITYAKRHFADWRAQAKGRLPHQAYVPGRVEPNYVFFSASLWSLMGSDETEPCNLDRAKFIEACRSLPGLRFEGGFDQVWKVRGFEKYTVEHRPSHAEYVSRTQRSCVVFNTPSRLGCHGWKLAEYMALGKAILSTELKRAMPAPLVHGQHIHFVEPTVEAIRKAVERIWSDDAYRRRLEAAARAYYEEHLQPARQVDSLLAAAKGPDALTRSGSTALFC